MPEWIQTLTVDASYNAGTGVTGIGVVIQQRSGRTGRGPILEQITEGHANVAQGAGEICAVYRALEIARQRGFARIKLRSDYNALRRSLREQHRSGRNDVAIRSLVLQLAQTFEWIDFGYVPRRKNQAAHALARQGRNLVAHGEQFQSSSGAIQASIP